MKKLTCLNLFHNKITSLEIPGNVVNIGRAAFDGNNELSSLTIKDGVVNIGRAAF